MELERVQKPAGLPLSRAELIAQSRIDETGEETLLDRLLAAAAEHVERVTGRCLMRQDWCLTLDGFPWGGLLRIPRAPVTGVLSVVYLAADGAEVTLAPSAYRLVGGGGVMPKLVPAVGHVWPTSARAVGAVRITFRAGAENASDVPESLRHAVALLAAHWFEHREAVAEVSSGTGMIPVPLGFDGLVAPFVVPWA